MDIKFEESDIVGKECRFAVLCPSDDEGNDLHLVKEVLHIKKDGVEFTVPNVQLRKNFKRDFYITKKGYRNHQDKKEYELINRVDKFSTTQSNLTRSISRALGMPGFKGDLRRMPNHQYIYGSDILSTAVIKQEYMTRYPNLTTPNSVGVYDTETDMLNGTGDIILATFTFKNKIYTAIDKKFVQGYANPEKEIREAFTKYLSDYTKELNPVIELIFVDNDAQAVVEIFKRIHKDMPDFLAIWNMTFDIPKSVDALKKHNIDPAYIFSDPRVPNQFKFFRYQEGKPQKVTAEGKITPLKYHERWHTVYTPASYYVIDAMCAYKKIRNQDGEEASYSLDYILNKVLGIRKLNFTFADHINDKAEWHRFMQAKYPIEYIIYNMFDCISVNMLDKKTTDLELLISILSSCSDYETFKSQPRRLCDKLHYELLAKGRVIGSTSGAMKTELDSKTLHQDGWIITLPANLIEDNGVRLFSDVPGLRTSTYRHVADLDVGGAYPTNTSCMNVSKATTRKELISIDGIPEHIFRVQNMNLCSGRTNAVEYCTVMFKAPPLLDLLKDFENELNQSQSFKEAA